MYNHYCLVLQKTWVLSLHQSLVNVIGVCFGLNFLIFEIKFDAISFIDIITKKLLNSYLLSEFVCTSAQDVTFWPIAPKRCTTEQPTRSPSIRELRQSATSLNFKISVDINCVITGDLASSHGRIMHLYSGWTHFTHLHTVFNCSLQPTGST